MPSRKDSHLDAVSLHTSHRECATSNGGTTDRPRCSAHPSNSPIQNRPEALELVGYLLLSIQSRAGFMSENVASNSNGLVLGHMGRSYGYCSAQGRTFRRETSRKRAPRWEITHSKLSCFDEESTFVFTRTTHNARRFGDAGGVSLGRSAQTAATAGTKPCACSQYFLRCSHRCECCFIRHGPRL